MQVFYISPFEMYVHYISQCSFHNLFVSLLYSTYKVSFSFITKLILSFKDNCLYKYFLKSFKVLYNVFPGEYFSLQN